MRKKTIALLLAAAMAISIAATGCNQAETESKTPAQSGQTGSASESESIVTAAGKLGCGNKLVHQRIRGKDRRSCELGNGDWRHSPTRSKS